MDAGGYAEALSALDISPAGLLATAAPTLAAVFASPYMVDMASGRPEYR